MAQMQSDLSSKLYSLRLRHLSCLSKVENYRKYYSTVSNQPFHISGHINQQM